jgi:scyllo-inositol 2-dehydrogenase (NADP+)
MVRFGIAGTGRITEEFIMSARAGTEAEPVAVYSRSAATGSAFARKHALAHHFTDLSDMVRSGKVDAVYIASPNSFHAPQAVTCLEHGIPVLVEKPAASNAIEFEAMTVAARKSGTLLMEAMKSTLVPAFDAIRDQLPKLGVIRHYFASYCQYSSRYDAYLAGEYRNAFDPALSNGSLMDIGIYGVYPAIQLFGAPRRVQASAELLSTGVDGHGSLILQYEGMDAVILHSKHSDSWLPAEIQGEKATLRLERINLPECVDILYRDGRVERIPISRPDPFMTYEIREFVRLLQNGVLESRINSLSVSLETLRVMDEARRQTGVAYPADVPIP